MIKTIDHGMRNPRPLLKAAFATRGFADVVRHFDAQRGPDSGWRALKPATLARRRKGRGAGSGKILQDTGNLRRNFLPANVEDSGQDSIVFFNSTPYAAAHDMGAPSKHLPQREFMWLSDPAQEDMINLILDKLIQ